MPKAKVVCRTSNKLRELRDKKNSVVADPSDYIVFEDKDDDEPQEPQNEDYSSASLRKNEPQEPPKEPPKEPKEQNEPKESNMHPSEIYKEIQYMKVLLDEFKASKTQKVIRLEQKNKERAELKAKKEKEKADRKIAREKESSDYKKYLESLILDGKSKQEQKYKANVQQLLHQARRATLQF